MSNNYIDELANIQNVNIIWNSSELEDYIEGYLDKFSDIAGNDNDLFLQLARDRFVIEYFLMAKYIREYSFDKIRNMDFIDTYLKYKEIFGSNAIEILVELLLPIKDSLKFLTRHFKVLERILQDNINETTKKFLNENGVSTDIDLRMREDLIETIIEQYKKMRVQSNIYGNENRGFYALMKNITFSTFLNFSDNYYVDKETVVRIGKEAGIFSNANIMRLPSVNGVHPLIDSDKLLDKFENSTLPKEEEKYLSQEDYVLRFVKYIQENNQKKFNIYLPKINLKELAKTICELYKKLIIDETELILIISNPIFADLDTNLKKNLKKEIKKILDIQIRQEKEEKNRIILPFSNKAVYELARLECVSDIDLIEIFERQESLPSEDAIKSNENLPNILYINRSASSIISIDEMREYFTAQKLLASYFKPKNNNLIEILSFYRRYILPKTSPQEFTEFESEILASEKVTSKDIVTFFSVGFISNEKMKELKQSNQEISVFLYQLVRETTLNSSNERLNDSNEKFIFDLLYSGLISKNELIDILGLETAEQIIINGLSREDVTVTPGNINSLSNLGFVRDYPETGELETYESEILSNVGLNAKQIVEFYLAGFISNETIKALKEKNPEIQEELHKFIRLQYSSEQSDEVKKAGIKPILYLVQNGIVDEFELMDVLEDNGFEQVIRSGLTNKAIKVEELPKFSFVDSKLLLDTYNSSLKERSNNQESLNIIDFNYILSAYLLHDGLISIGDIQSIIEVGEEPEFTAPSFTNLSKYIYQTIKSCGSVGIEKIRKLYLNNYLIFDDLNELVQDGIIESEEADNINKEFCTPERIQEIRNMTIENSSKGKEKSHHSKRKFDLSNLSRSQNQQIEQAKIMIQILRSLGYTAKTENNLNGLLIMSTFSSGVLKNFRFFLSEENPTAIILAHFNQVPNSYLYYQGGENKVYTVSTSTIYNYLNNQDTNLGVAAEEVVESKYTLQTRLGKNFANTIQRTTEQMNNMLNSASLEAHVPEGDRKEVIDNCTDDIKNEKRIEQL